MNFKQKQEQVFRIIGNSSKQKPTFTIVDMHNDFEKDDKICLTTVAFVPPNMARRIRKEIITPLKKADSRQYFYPQESMHVTIQNIRVINKPPNFTEKDIELVKDAFEEILSKTEEFSLELKGLLMPPTSAAIKVYFDEDVNDLILKLRRRLVEIRVPDDKSYISKDIAIGNITFCRFTTQPNKRFIEEYNKLKNIDVGKMDVNKLCLITTNCVCHPNKTKIIKEFGLKRL